MCVGVCVHVCVGVCARVCRCVCTCVYIHHFVLHFVQLLVCQLYLCCMQCDVLKSMHSFTICRSCDGRASVLACK